MTKSVLVAVALLAVFAAPARAQDPIRIGVKVGVPAPVVVPGGYDDGARRDPFISLIAPKRLSPQARPVTGGLRSVSVSEAKVTGIQNFGNRSAFIEGPDGKTYTVRPQDKLFDGVVKAIEADAVVFVEQMVDALGAVRSREVRKVVRAGGGGQ